MYLEQLLFWAKYHFLTLKRQFFQKHGFLGNFGRYSYNTSHPSISRNAHSRGSTYHYTREVILIFLERGDLGEPDLLVIQAKFLHVHILYPPSEHVFILLTNIYYEQLLTIKY